MKQPNIVVVGSLNMDIVLTIQNLPKVGETIRGEQIHYVSGGKGANQAVGCSRLGAQVNMIGAVGDDLFGQQILSRMQQFGVAVSGISTKTDTPTGTATILHTHGDNCIIIIPGANGLCSVEMVAAQEQMIQHADVLLVQLEIPLPTVLRSMEIARSAGVPVVLNPAPALDLPDEFIRMADVFTPNETEFEYFCKTSLETEQQLFDHMTKWQSHYNQTLIVTRGKYGVSFISNHKPLATIPAPTVPVVDTTGAGDCFNAALSYFIALGWDLEQSVVQAVKAASISVAKFGAQDGMPTMDELTGS